MNVVPIGISAFSIMNEPVTLNLGILNPWMHSVCQIYGESMSNIVPAARFSVVSVMNGDSWQYECLF
jgi:hypothetical protein